MGVKLHPYCDPLTPSPGRASFLGVETGALCPPIQAAGLREKGFWPFWCPLSQREEAGVGRAGCAIWVDE